MPSRSDVESVLAMWRQVERDLAAVELTSDEAARLIDQLARLRAEHQRLTEQARRRSRPAPQPWPERESAV